MFGGGLALYSGSDVVGGLGVSGDTSCADHNIAWRLRHALQLDHVPNGVTPDHNDGIIYDMLADKTSASGYGHVTCKGTGAQIAEQLHAGLCLCGPSPLTNAQSWFTPHELSQKQ